MNLLPVSSSAPGSLTNSPSRGVKRSLSESSKEAVMSQEKRQKTPLSSPERSFLSPSVSPVTRNIAALSVYSGWQNTPSILRLPRSPGSEETQIERIWSIVENPTPFFVKMKLVSNDENFSLDQGLSILNDYYAALLEIRDMPLDESHFLYPDSILTLCRLRYRVELCLVGSTFLEEIDEKFRKHLEMVCSLLDFSKDQSGNLQKLLVREEYCNDPAYAILKQIFLEKKYISLSGKQVQFVSEKQILHHVLECVKSPKTEIDEKVQQLALHLLQLVEKGEHVGVCSLFHAVKNIQNVGPILRSKILVTQEQRYPGAFVSTRHEGGIGDCAVVVSAQTVAAKRLSRIEKRSEEEGGGVWIGSKDPLTPNRSRVVHLPLSPNTHRILKKSLPAECILVESAVQDQFNQYARQLNDMIPIALGKTFSDIAPWHEAREEDVDMGDYPFA